MMYQGFSILDGLQENFDKLKVSNLTLSELDLVVKNIFSGLDDLMLRQALVSALAPKMVEHEIAVAAWRFENPDNNDLPEWLVTNENVLHEAKQNIKGEYTWFEIEY